MAMSSSEKRLVELRAYYSELSDDALLEAIQQGQNQYESDAWTVMCDVACARGIPEASLVEQTSTEAHLDQAGTPESSRPPFDTAEELNETIRQVKQRQSSGYIVLMLGILVSVGSIVLAGPGGTYVVAFGAIFVGVRRLLDANASLERLERMRSEREAA